MMVTTEVAIVNGLVRMVRQRDPITAAHLDAVGLLTARLGEALGLDPANVAASGFTQQWSVPINGVSTDISTAAGFALLWKGSGLFFQMRRTLSGPYVCFT